MNADNAKDATDDMSHEERITLLKYDLEQLVEFDSYVDSDIPEKVIEAFVRKIVVSKEGFEWYLRFSPNDDPPTMLQIEGKRQKNAKVSSLCDMQHRLLLQRCNQLTNQILQNIKKGCFGSPF